MRATADSNIHVSAAQFGGPPRHLLDMAREGAFELCVSAPILNEVSRVLRDKFAWQSQRIEDALALLLSFATLVEPAQRLDVVREDPSDNRILECALAAGADYVVTGDKHLLRLGRHEGIEIVTVREFLTLVQGQRRER